MKLSIMKVIIITTIFANSGITSASNQKQYTICLGPSKIDFNPFREFKDPGELAYYFLLYKSFISNDPKVDGILSKYHFSSNGLKLKATVAKTAKWLDGKQITAKDAALSIAKGMTFRRIGKKIVVKGTQSINKTGWKHQSYSGIKIISDTDFELTFESNIKSNIIGTLKEALSTGSRHNRLWPARLDYINDTDYEKGQFDLASKYPVSKKDSAYYVKYKNHLIKINTETNCQGDFHFISKPTNDFDFNKNLSNSSQSIIAIVNGNNKSLKTKAERQSLAKFLRQAFSEDIKNSDSSNYQISKAHFLNREPGYLPHIDWSKNEIEKKLFIKNIKLTSTININSTHPLLKKLRKFAVNKAINVSISKQPFDLSHDVHAIIIGARVEQGRQIWLQDYSNDIQKASSFYKFTAPFSKTAETIKNIQSNSASTIPTKIKILQNFETTNFEEVAIIPLYRTFLIAYSHKSAPFKLKHNPQDELIFE